jgi:hypothetical protein
MSRFGLGVGRVLLFSFQSFFTSPGDNEEAQEKEPPEARPVRRS